MDSLRVLGLLLPVLFGPREAYAVATKGSFKCSLKYSSEANIEFSTSLLLKVLQAEHARSNVMLSPIAVGSGLSMLLAGATGITKRQIVRGLKLDQSRDYADGRIPCFTRVYNRRIFSAPNLPRIKLKKSTSEPTILKKATKIYGERSVKYNTAFLRKSSYYGTRLERVNFRNSPSKARDKINSWVSRHTSSKISNFLKPGAVKRTTNLLLVTTIYFKGTWENLFMGDNTRKDKFYSTARDIFESQFMENLSFYRTLKLTSPFANLVELPYRKISGSGLDASMILIMPSNCSSLADFVSGLSEKYSGGLNEIFQQLLARRKSYYNVLVPKFNISTERDMERTLKRMGIRNIFGKNADLRQMIYGRSGQMHLDLINHQTILSVNERGTEAAGTTGFRFGIIAEPPVLKFDRPFIVVILEKLTNSILFIGKIGNPSAN